jgi:hypothetical protein
MNQFCASNYRTLFDVLADKVVLDAENTPLYDIFLDNADFDVFEPGPLNKFTPFAYMIEHGTLWLLEKILKHIGALFAPSRPLLCPLQIVGHSALTAIVCHRCALHQRDT